MTKLCAGLWPGRGDGAGFPHASPSACSDILNSPKLAPELQGVRLGTLLPPTQIQLLEATFLSNEVVSPGPVPGGAEVGAGRKQVGAGSLGQTGCRQGAWQGRPRGLHTTLSGPPTPQGQREGADGPSSGAGVEPLDPGCGPAEAGRPLPQ